MWRQDCVQDDTVESGCDYDDDDEDNDDAGGNVIRCNFIATETLFY